MIEYLYLRDVTVYPKTINRFSKIKQSHFKAKVPFEPFLQSVIDMISNKVTIISFPFRQLAVAKDGFTTRSLGLVANFRKRQQLVGLMKSLHTIKTLVCF